MKEALEILESLNEKIIIMRHDVDSIWNVYGEGKLTKIKKFINHAYIQLSPLRARYFIPNYLENVWLSIDLEKEYNARASYFFRVPTAPTKEIVKELLRNHHEIGYHSDRNFNFKAFYNDLKTLERIVGVKIIGFTKHGRSPTRDGGPWIEEKFINYGIRAGLKYIAQGEGHFDWELPHVIRGIIVFGHHVTPKRSKPNEVKEYIKRKKLPMILVHPEDIPLIKGLFEEILTMGRIVSVKEALKILRMI